MRFLTEVLREMYFLMRQLISGGGDPFPGLPIELIEVFQRQSIDTRLSKIELAKQNLKDALSAVDQLKAEAEKSKGELEDVVQRLAEAHNKKKDVESEIAAASALAISQTAAVRKVLGVPSRAQRWAERCLAFALGFAASLLASWVWSIF